MICDEGLKSQRVIIRGFGTAILLEAFDDIPQSFSDTKKEQKITLQTRNDTMSKSYHFNEKKI
jgi:hypothetical protein